MVILYLFILYANAKESLFTVLIIRNLLTPQVSNNKQALFHVLVENTYWED